MSVYVLLPTPLRRFTGGEKRIPVEAGTALEAMDALAEAYPDLRAQLFDDSGQLRRFVNLYLGDRNARQLAPSLAEVTVDDGAELTIVPAIAGGSAIRLGRDHVGL